MSLRIVDRELSWASGTPLPITDAPDIVRVRYLTRPIFQNDGSGIARQDQASERRFLVDPVTGNEDFPLQTPTELGAPGCITQIIRQGGTIVQGTVPEGVSGPLTIDQLLLTYGPGTPYNWQIVADGVAPQAPYVVVPGPIGASGPIGPTGPIGPSGGPVGPVGPPGAVGPIGPIGPIGLTGTTGAAGAVGPAGTAGAVGATGAIGVTGATGTTGPQGATGPIGLTGPTGTTGAVGPIGPIGTTGATGATGSQGPIGLTGPAGATGATGAQGIAGAVGPQGPIGVTGPTGSTGATGATGPQGATGPAGPNIAATTTAIGSLQLAHTQVASGPPIAALQEDLTATTTTANAAIPSSQKGAVSGVAPLNASSLVSSAYLPVAGTTLGGVKSGGSGITIAADGTISSTTAGGMTNPMTTVGDTIYGAVSGAPTRLAAGTSSQVFVGGASAPAWGPVPLAAISGITTTQLSATAGILGSQLSASAAIVSAQITSLDASKVSTGVLPLAQLSGITSSQLAAGAGILGSQLSATAAIAAGQIGSINPSTLTGSGTIPNAALPALVTAGTSAYPASVTYDAYGRITAITAGSAPTGGTVTSVGLTAPSIFTVTGSPVTGSGTLALALGTQSANTVLAGPSSGAVLAPTFRVLAAADIPSLDTSKITTGTLPVVRGGSGLSAAPTDGQLLIGSTAGGGYALSTLTAGANVTITNAAGAITIAAAATGSAGMANPMSQPGDMIVGGAAGTPTALADVAVGQVLRSGGVATAPSWGPVSLAAAVNTARIVTTTLTLTSTDSVVIVGAANLVITMPDATTMAGRTLTFKNNGSGTNTSLSGSGTQTIDGQATQILSRAWASVSMFSFGGVWNIV